MERKEFMQGCCAVACLVALPRYAAGTTSAALDDLGFTRNFLSDLMETIDAEVDEPTKIKLLSGCGRACFRRFQFKQDIAAKGKGSVEELVKALKANYEAWREGDQVHIRYGAVNRNGCYCPAAKYRPSTPSDIHCYCTRAMHEAIWQAALGRPIKIDIVETVRRGGATCHFLVHLA
jgi:hypothetical protein